MRATLTESPGASAASASRSAGRSGAVSSLLLQLMSVGVTLILARLLSPGEFGLVAIAQSAAGVAALLANIGLGAALVRAVELTRLQISTSFWFASGLGLGLACLSFISSSWLARALGQPEATELIRILSPALALNLIAAVPRALLQREFRLRAVYRLDVFSFAVYGIVQVQLATAGFGARSVVVGQVAMSLVSAVGLVIISRLRPRFAFSWRTLEKDVGFSAQVLALSSVNYVAKNVDYWIISRAFGAQFLGLYYVGLVLPTILRQRVSGLMADISYPYLARARSDPERLRNLYLRSSLFSLFLALPAMVGLSIISEDVLRLCFGEQWLRAAPAMSWIALAAGLEVSVPITGVVFTVLGRPLRSARPQVLRVIILGVLLATVVTTGASIASVGAAVFFATTCSACAAHLQAGRALHSGFAIFLEPLRPVVLPCIVLAAVLLPLTASISDNLGAGMTVGICVVVGVCTYLVAGVAVGGPRFKEQLGELRRIAQSSRG